MVRELAIWLYLVFFKVFFQIFKLFPLKNKVTFVVSFGDNSLYVYRALRKQNVNIEVIFLAKQKTDFLKEVDEPVLSFETANVIDMIQSIYHLATSKYIFIDNYYGFLSAVSFKKEVQCIQLWHAAGALKQFGLKDLSIKKRSKRAQKRFLKVYEKFHKVVVGSNEMAKIFMESFNLTSDRILKTGVPRTDLFFDLKSKKKIRDHWFSRFPIMKNKKVILYAPTYRDNLIENFRIQLDFKKMYDALCDEYIIIIKLHPAVREQAKNLESTYNGFVYDLSEYDNINELLIITDILITDYSSVPFEFSLLQRPMLFFVYDFDQYSHTRGIIENYKKEVPGPIVYNTDEIIHHIKKGDYNIESIVEFSKKWNQYSDGKSSERLVRELFQSDYFMYKGVSYESKIHGIGKEIQG